MFALHVSLLSKQITLLSATSEEFCATGFISFWILRVQCTDCTSLYASVTPKVLSQRSIPAKNLPRRNKVDKREEEGRSKVVYKEDKDKGKEEQEDPRYPSLQPSEVEC